MRPVKVSQYVLYSTPYTAYGTLDCTRKGSPSDNMVGQLQFIIITKYKRKSRLANDIYSLICTQLLGPMFGWIKSLIQRSNVFNKILDYDKYLFIIFDFSMLFFTSMTISIRFNWKNQLNCTDSVALLTSELTIKYHYFISCYFIFLLNVVAIVKLILTLEKKNIFLSGHCNHYQCLSMSPSKHFCQM